MSTTVESAVAPDGWSDADLVNKVKCAASEWPRALSTLAPKTAFVPLSTEFMKYLQADGVFLPASCNTREQDFSDDESWGSDPPSSGQRTAAAAGGGSGADAEDDDARAEPGAAFDFTELQGVIKGHVTALSGSIIAKLFWSSPRDASWVNTGGLVKCSHPEEIFAILKSSGNISADLDLVTLMQFRGLTPPPFNLMLRRWVELSSAGLFRCFIHDHCLVAASQRDKTNFFPSVLAAKDAMSSQLQRWFDRHMDAFPIDDFVCDVHIDDPEEGAGCTLLDIDIWHHSVDPVMFDWVELNDHIASDKPFEFRILEGEPGVVPSATMLNGLPADLTAAGGIDGVTADELVDAVRRAAASQAPAE